MAYYQELHFNQRHPLSANFGQESKETRGNSSSLDCNWTRTLIKTPIVLVFVPLWILDLAFAFLLCFALVYFPFGAKIPSAFVFVWMNAIITLINCWSLC